MRPNLKTKVISIGGIAALALTAACSNHSTSGAGGLGSADSKSADSQTTSVKIGFQGPLSGDYQQLGINEVNGIQLAVDEANAKNTYGFKVTLVRSDDQGDPAKAPAAAATLIQNNSVLAAVGPAFSGTTKAVGSDYSSANLAFITPSATNATLQTLGFKSFHRMVPSDDVEGTQAAAWLARKKIKEVFVVDDLSDYGKGVAAAVEKELKARGVRVLRQGVDSKTTDYSVVANAVKNSGAGALFYGGYDAQAALFAKALKSVGYDGLTLTGNGGKSSVFTSQAGAAGNGWYFTCGCLDAATAPSAKKFAAAYEAAFHEPPSTFSPESYDATNALLAAIKAAAAHGNPTRQSVADAVNHIDYKGITTVVRFDTNGDADAGVSTVNLYQQKRGKIVQLGNIKKMD
ncbi:branched-chain amino acid ABC transporter substrate-binding protein [Streptomyces sp. NPDC006668]|uniref:branched-chain amino acid ABC transporter substrate-binding protein n=1 Tax=Streptomyces sp. NPDC006668 TaxID=3156903 RepID=UPI0033D94D11